MKKIFITLIALSLVRYAPAQADSTAAVSNRTQGQGSKAADSSEPSGDTDGLAGKSDDARIPAAFAKDMSAPGVSLSIFPDPAAQVMQIDVKGAPDAEFRAVLTNAQGDIVATRTITASYEWDLFAQEPGRYQLVILSKKDGGLLARKRFVKN